MKRRLSLLLAAALLLLPVHAAMAAADMTVIRIEGKSRYDTAVQLSINDYQFSDTVILASGTNYPDALAGGLLAAALPAPLLLTQNDEIASATLAEMDRLGASKVYLLGGEATISVGLEKELEKRYEVKRLSGENRSQTAAAIRQEIYNVTGRPANPNVAEKYLIGGNSYPDALASIPYVFQANGILNFYNRELFPDRTGHIAIGGDIHVPAPVKARLAGANRYATAVHLAENFPRSFDTVILVDGTNFPDAVAASGFAAAHGWPILLTAPHALPAETEQFLTYSDIDRVLIVGGGNSVSPAIENTVRSLQP